jgi:hypothetical protein
LNVSGLRFQNTAEFTYRPFSFKLGLAGRTIVKLAREWWELRGNNPNEVQYFFDRDFEDWGMLCDRVRADLGITLQPANSREVRPLQAADWLAYESGKEAPQYYDWENRKRKPRQSFLKLLYLGSQPSIFQENDLRKLCEDPRAAIPKRGSQIISDGKVVDAKG